MVRKRALISWGTTAAALVALCPPAFAQAQDATQAGTVPQPDEKKAPQNAGNDGLGVIVVTARREAENLQKVPISIQAITSDQIQSLALTNVSDISKLTPGLAISNDSGTSPIVVLRGVRWTEATGTPAIPIYINEVSFAPGAALQSMYDLGQIEVLRGPQGTSRGAPSISGAVTLSTKEPDLNRMGGYVSGMLGTRNRGNAQGAASMPILPGVLAVRIAGLIDTSEGNGVRSFNSPLHPSEQTLSGRISVRFQPTDTLRFDVMYQHLDQKAHQFSQVAGTGSPGVTVDPLLPAAFGGGPSLVLPPNYNSPAINAADYRSVESLQTYIHSKIDMVTLNASWDFMGQRLSYIFGLQIDKQRRFFGSDPAHTIIGYEAPIIVDERHTKPYFSHEVRLSSIRGGHFLDYDLGFYYHKSNSPLTYDLSTVFEPGAFGVPVIAASSPFVNPAAAGRYVVPVHLDIVTGERDYSFYGDLEMHLPFGIEATGGVRWNHYQNPSRTITSTGAAEVALPRFLPAAFGGCPSALLPNSAVYGPAFCDLPIPAMQVGDDSFSQTITPTIYNVSLSKKFSDNILGYATVGTSFRPGMANIGNSGLPANLLFTAPEKATSYEAGIKTTLLDHHVRLNADVFQIDYKGQLTQYANTPYFNTISNQVAATSESYVSNANARVRGIEADITVEPIRNLTLDGNVSYSKIKSQGGEAPCSDPSRPLSTTNLVNFCPVVKGRNINPTSPFQYSLTGNYVVSFDPFDGYIRFIIDHQGHDPAYGVSDVPVRGYTLVDLFLGVNGNRNAWDLGLYAKNVFNVKRELGQSAILPTVPAFGATGLSQVSETLRREIGLTFKYSFGSR